MNGQTKIQSGHLQRQAVLYLRQSSPKQVLQNRESAINQRALQERLLAFGWKKQQITVIDEDQGLTGKHTSGRQGFQRLVADVSLRKVGIVMGYEVSRLSRSSADWHRLFELCALFDTLIADSDGVYNPRDFNDRLLLSLKGTMSEAELHSLRLRLDAGRLSKAKRGELIQHVPTGFVRTEDGAVRMDPDSSVRERIQLVFEKFVELGSINKVLRYFVRSHLKLPRRQTSGLYAGDVLWKDPSAPALNSILKNPAYAGAFSYGRRICDPTRQDPTRPATGRIRKPRTEWLALVKDRYPAYISWEGYERIQLKIKENQQKMQDLFARAGAGSVRKGAALLSGLVRCGLCGHRMGTGYKEKRVQYICVYASGHYARSSCQFISGIPIDQAVAEEFFKVLNTAQIDALEKISENHHQHHMQLVRHLETEVERLAYDAKRAERRYKAVDPENRLIASTLEKEWEMTMQELEEAKGRLAELKNAPDPDVKVPQDLREAFANVGKRMPEVWLRISPKAKKSLIRTLVQGVNLRRKGDGTVHVRIAWRGGATTERVVRVRVFSFKGTETGRKLLEKIRQLADQETDDQRIARRLNEEGFTPCRGEKFTWQIVRKLRRQHKIVLGLMHVRRGHSSTGYSIREMARLIEVHPSWIRHRICDGHIEIAKDPQAGVYFFPRTAEAVEKMRQLKNHNIRHASFLKVH